jgi:hypothetical protein
LKRQYSRSIRVGKRARVETRGLGSKAAAVAADNGRRMV